MGNQLLHSYFFTMYSNGIINVDNENVSSTKTTMIPHVLQMKHFDHDYVNKNVSE